MAGAEVTDPEHHALRAQWRDVERVLTRLIRDSGLTTIGTLGAVGGVAETIMGNPQGGVVFGLLTAWLAVRQGKSVARQFHALKDIITRRNHHVNAAKWQTVEPHIRRVAVGTGLITIGALPAMDVLLSHTEDMALPSLTGNQELLMYSASVVAIGFCVQFMMRELGTIKKMVTRPGRRPAAPMPT